MRFFSQLKKNNMSVFSYIVNRADSFSALTILMEVTTMNDMIDQMFPPVPEDNSIDGLYRAGYAPWQIIQSVHNSSVKEMKTFYAAHEQDSDTTNVHMNVEVKRK